ncbi:Fringe-like protein [Nitzschia inconspicua]|uniref:N-acetylgalactosaminide beta-1,3-galactosyltransferase n=1 Tax=Nitzschia inconspicua TaxID=303405 RepID=A0A9K3L376_9STRA|nr:Fringe-like protein [Nitzschia inconspicua]
MKTGGITGTLFQRLETRDTSHQQPAIDDNQQMNDTMTVNINASLRVLFVVSGFIVWMSLFRTLQISRVVLDEVVITSATSDDSSLSSSKIIAADHLFIWNIYGSLNDLETDSNGLSSSNRSVPIPGTNHFQGALDGENQSIVHDPYALRKRGCNILTEELDCDVPPGKGPEGIMGYDEKLQIQQPANKSSSTSHENDPGPYRILCAIYTYEGHSNQTLAVADIWGARCDGFLVASTHLAKGLAYVYQNFLEEFDFVFLSGDDTYLVVENLKAWLASHEVLQATKNHTEPFYGGMYTRHVHEALVEAKLAQRFVYHGGGSGYTLNRAALKIFVERGLDHSDCFPETVKSEEDLFMGLCMRHLGLTPVLAARNTNFLQYPTDPKGIIDLTTMENRVKNFWERQLRWFSETHNITLKTGLDAVSEASISFHGIKSPSYMRRMNSIVYRSLDGD